MTNVAMSRPITSVAQLGADAGSFIAQHLDTTFRALMTGPGFVKQPRYIRLLTGEPHPFGNFSLMSVRTNIAATREAIEPLTKLPVPAAVLFSGESDAPVAEALLAENQFGFVHSMPAMAVDIERVPATNLPAGYTFERIPSGPKAAEWEQTFAVGYEFPRGVAKYFSPVSIADDGSPNAPAQFFGIRKDGQLVGTSMAYMRDGVVGIYCVATVPDERGKGLGAHATAEPLRLASRIGYNVGVLQSSDAGHSVYKRLGFEAYGGVPLYVRMPSE